MRVTNKYPVTLWSKMAVGTEKKPRIKLNYPAHPCKIRESLYIKCAKLIEINTHQCCHSKTKYIYKYLWNLWSNASQYENI